MTTWIPYVYVRVAIFFIAGILIGIWSPHNVDRNVLTTSLFLLMILYGGAFIVKLYLNRNLAIVGLIALTTVFLSGYLCVDIRDATTNDHHFIHVSDKVECYQAIVTQLPQSRERSWKFEAEMMRFHSNGEWKRVNGNILIYLSKADFPQPFQYGDILIVRGSPQRVPDPGNPGEFDYKQFLGYRNIYHQQFLRKRDVKFILNKPQHKFLQWAFQIRVQADSTLKKYIHGAREQATASALVLGVTDGLDDELLQAYSATGTMHALAVSGLHISIIYLILAFVLKPLKRFQHGHIYLAVISIVALWSYSFVTGLSPSVLRAVVMFTFMAVSRATRRQTNIYNTLAAAAFCLLIYDPYMIMSVGFQLSFLAVLGIVYVQPLLQRWWKPKTMIIDEIWKVSCVSIAAQIVTFPLCLLYFHQFPNYFLLSNLFVIPGSFVVLLVGIATLAFGFIQPVGFVLGFILEWTIRILNWIIFLIESFPFSMIENISITAEECWILTGIVALVVLMMVKRNLQFLKAGIALSTLFLFLRFYDYSHQVKPARLTIYKIPGHTAIDLSGNGHTLFYADSLLLADDQKIRFHIQPNRQLQSIRITEPELLVATNGIQLIVWNGKCIAHVRRKEAEWPQRRIKPDMIVVSNNSIRSVSAIPKDLLSVPIILDSSNSFYFADRLLRDAEKNGVNIYSVLHQGAFIMK